jgi:putative ABC transport system permease protein
VLLDTLRLVTAGIALGLAISVLSGRLLTSLLYGVTAQEPFIMAGAVLLMMLVGAIAACTPAYRASRTDPAIVLRND